MAVLIGNLAIGALTVAFYGAFATLDSVMKFLGFLALCSCIARTGVTLAGEQITGQVDEFLQVGKFREAALFLRSALDSTHDSPAGKLELEFELERLRRIRKDYSLTDETLFSALQTRLRGLTHTEFRWWIDQNRFDARRIDGKRFFMGSSVANLFFRYPELNSRRTPRRDTTEFDTLMLRNCREIALNARQSNTPYVLPKRFKTEMNLSLAPSGSRKSQELISAWLPIPRDYPFQTAFRLISSSSVPQHVSESVSSIRAIYLEQPALPDGSAEFTIDYEYTMRGVCFVIDPTVVSDCSLDDPTLRRYLSEAPHVLFTAEIRALSQELAGTGANPYLKARRFYDWISENISYSFALEYSTIRNLSDYCLRNRYGDCGQEALLFITLCRLNNIPARWQSGWSTFPGAHTVHDWTEVYLEPYGWVPVDPYMGIYAMQYAASLSRKQRRWVRDFYFGGLDHYRMIANSDHNQLLKPEKRSFRSDGIDFQRGELECCGTNIYFDEFSYKLTAEETDPDSKSE